MQNSKRNKSLKKTIYHSRVLVILWNSAIIIKSQRNRESGSMTDILCTSKMKTSSQSRWAMDDSNTPGLRNLSNSNPSTNRLSKYVSSVRLIRVTKSNLPNNQVFKWQGRQIQAIVKFFPAIPRGKNGLTSVSRKIKLPLSNLKRVSTRDYRTHQKTWFIIGVSLIRTNRSSHICKSKKNSSCTVKSTSSNKTRDLKGSFCTEKSIAKNQMKNLKEISCSNKSMK